MSRKSFTSPTAAAMRSEDEWMFGAAATQAVPTGEDRSEAATDDRMEKAVPHRLSGGVRIRRGSQKSRGDAGYVETPRRVVVPMTDSMHRRLRAYVGSDEAAHDSVADLVRDAVEAYLDEVGY